MHVRNILDTKGARVVTIRPDATIMATSRLLAQHRIGAVLVTDDAEHVVGVVSERDIVTGLANHGAGVTDMTVGELMTREVLSCALADTIADIMTVMTKRRVRHLPVIDDGKLVGIVSIGDVVKHRLDETALEVDSLRDYVLAAR